MIERHITVWDHEPWCKSMVVFPTNPPQYQRCNCSEEAKAIQRVRKLHNKVTRWGNEDMSLSAEQYAEDGGSEEWPDLEPFDVCAECCRMESAEEQQDEWDVAHLGCLWPCPTRMALDGEA